MTSNAQGVSPLEFLKSVPIGRLLLLGFGAFAMVLAIVFVMKSSQSPAKQILFSGLDPAEVPAVLEVLEGNSVPYVLQAMDTILIPSKDVAAMKMQLAAKGIPRGGVRGYDVVSKSENVYGKTDMEQYVLYKQAYEQEIESAISTLDAVKHARVLLAIPQTNRLLRNKGLVKASVVLTTWNGQSLSKDQINGIVKLVVDSVPELDRDNVSVVDQSGKQLNVVDTGSVVSNERIEFVQNLELERERKIVSLVESFVGTGNVKVAVTADVDFSHREIRKDQHDNSNQAIRSQQLASSGVGIRGVIPGAIANQPPAAGMAPEQTAAQLESGAGGSAESITNYEIDKTSMYEVAGKGRISRLAVSVVVNNKKVPDGDDGFIFQVRNNEEMARIQSLVSAAVGFEEVRGDVLFVSSENFEDTSPDIVFSDEEPSMLDKPWVGDAINQLLAVFFCLLVFFGILKPILKSSTKNMDIERAQEIALASERESAEAEAKKRAKIANMNETVEQRYSRQKLEVEKVLQEDSKRTNQILKHWMATSNGE